MNILSRQVLNRKEFEPRLDHWYLVLGVRPNRERVIQPFEVELGKTTVTGQARKLYDLEDDFSEDVEGIALRIAATARAGLAH